MIDDERERGQFDLSLSLRLKFPYCFLAAEDLLIWFHASVGAWLYSTETGKIFVVFVLLIHFLNITLIGFDFINLFAFTHAA